MSSNSKDLVPTQPAPAPVTVGATAGSGLLAWLGQLPKRFGLSGQSTLRDRLEHALATEQTGGAGQFSAEERAMLIRILRFGASRVEDIMVPRADITAIEETETLRDLVLLFETAGVSRIPVYVETLDDPRGMIHIKDLFRWVAIEAGGVPETDPDKVRLELTKPKVDSIDLDRPITAAKIRRPVLYVPPSMPAMNLLIKMQSTRIHMALVVDEYGGTDGLVTIEDLVEQVVGDIEDEHDEAEASLISTDPKLGLVAFARAPIDAVETRLGVKLLSAEDEEEIDTLGGLVFALVGRVPVRGEVVRHPSGIEFEVLDADPRRVKKLRIHKPAAAPETPAGIELAGSTDKPA